MVDYKFFQEAPLLSMEFINNLDKDNKYNFVPTPRKSTLMGRKINMGFNCYALKMNKITNEWEKKTETEKKHWISYINSFQDHNISQFENYFIDIELYDYFNKKLTKFNLKNVTKSLLNLVNKNSYQSSEVVIYKTLIADNKQTISTLNELGYNLNKKFIFNLNDLGSVENYLSSYDWSKPWDAGAQFSSLAVYTKTLSLGLELDLIEFISNKIDKETGSYFDIKPDNNRQVINGAMKVISGLDWLNIPIHNPKKLIDFCLNNKPIFEGCDLVDYVYVLYKCAKETNYKRNEISEVLKLILNDIRKMFNYEYNGFSYFLNKSQTHYYGVRISKGKNFPDIHGTLLSNWAIVMILDILEMNKYEFKTIKP